MEDNMFTIGPVMNTTIPNNNSNDLTVVAVPLATNGENNSINGEKKHKKKRSGGLNFLKSAMLILRLKPNENTKPSAIQLDVTSMSAADNLKKIVGSMRPLHLQDNSSLSPSPSQSPLPLTVNTNFDDIDEQNQSGVEQFEDVIVAPPSPTLSTSSFSADSASVYGSAMNLQELDKSDDEEVNDQVFDDKPADEMIDVKAEEFIAYFYAQMRLQQLDSAYHNHHT